MGKIYTFLHVFDDEKFFDGASGYFSSLENVRNLFFFYHPDKNFHFKHIKHTEKIRLFSDYKEYVSWFSNEEVDAIYFQGLCDRNHYCLAKYIGEKQKVFWWSFGAELYNIDALSPLIRLPLLKPKTLKQYNHFRNTNVRQLIKRLYFMIVSPYYNSQRRIFLKRVDYYTPVLSIEYDLLRQSQPLFRAKPFMLECGPSRKRDFPLIIKNVPGNVIVGNSLTYSNNYLDLKDALDKVELQGSRKYVYPISYGFDYGGKEHFKKIMDLANNDRIILLETFVPNTEYFKLFDNVSHAIFGFVRQQGVGNIRFCLRNGIKVFLYRDSIAYKQYISWGYKVFTIEDDLTTESLASCLSEEDARINHTLSLGLYTHSHRELIEKEIDKLFADKL